MKSLFKNKLFRSFYISINNLDRKFSQYSLNLYEEKNLGMHHRILVGPEGGFHKDEIDLALSSGIQPIDLGPRIMRSETAAISASSILQFLCGDLK